MSMNQPRFDDAALIIEQFGGIRPMSNKTNIPVTTIQGWKKRGTIPKSRRDEVLAFATQNDIDLTGSLNLTDTPAQETIRKKEGPAANENGGPKKKLTSPSEHAQSIDEALKMMDRKMTLKSALMSLGCALIAVAFLIFLRIVS